MQPQSDAEYKQLLTDVIKKQIVILGPDITLIKARNVPGLTVIDDGTVTAISGEPQAITQALIDQFVQLSGLIVKKTMEPLLMYHPDGAPSTQTPAPAAPAAEPVVQQQPTATPIQPVTPPMPQGTQPIVQPTSAQPLVQSQGTQPLIASQPAVDPAPVATPTSPEIDMNTQKIINEALQQV
ncbi:MAG TPA: hypothetical protein VF820_04230 [Patescibacteria group bacterium]